MLTSTVVPRARGSSQCLRTTDQDEEEPDNATHRHVDEPGAEELLRRGDLPVSEAATMEAMAQIGFLSPMNFKVAQTITVAIITLIAKRNPIR